MPGEADLMEASQRSWCLIEALLDESYIVGIGRRRHACIWGNAQSAKAPGSLRTLVGHLALGY